MTDIVPPFNPVHLWSEQIIILRNEAGVYGKIEIHYPTAMDGGPDMEGTRLPHFTGYVQLIGIAQNGAQTQIPLAFRIDAPDAITAAEMFAATANKAAADFQAESFRQALSKPGIITQ